MIQIVFSSLDHFYFGLWVNLNDPVCNIFIIAKKLLVTVLLERVDLILSTLLK